MRWGWRKGWTEVPAWWCLGYRYWKAQLLDSGKQSNSKVSSQQAAEKQSRACPGTASINHDALLVLVCTDWPCRPLPARIMAVESQGCLHLQPLLDTPANHASGAFRFREACRCPPRPKPLHANAATLSRVQACP